MDDIFVSMGTVLQWAVGGIGFLLAFIIKSLKKEIREAQADLKMMMKDIPETYVRREEFRSAMLDMREMLTERFDRMDAKFAAVFRKLDNHVTRDHLGVKDGIQAVVPVAQELAGCTPSTCGCSETCDRVYKD